MDLNECFRKGMIKKTRKNKQLILSIIKTANIKEETVQEAKVTEKNIIAYVSMAYDSLREILEAICVSQGYKVLSHICMGEFLKEKIKQFDFKSFDRFRYIRNGINYYGQDVEYNQGKEIIEKIFNMKKELMGKHLAEFI